MPPGSLLTREGRVRPRPQEITAYRATLVTVALAVVLLSCVSVLAGTLQFSMFLGLAAAGALSLLPLAAFFYRGQRLFFPFVETLLMISMSAVGVFSAYQVLLWMWQPEQQQPVGVFAMLAAVVALYAFYLLLRIPSLSGRYYTATSVKRLDLLFRGSPLLLALGVATVLTCVSLVAMFDYALHAPSFALISQKFLERGIIPPITLILFYWGAIILLHKAVLLWSESRMLAKKSRFSTIMSALRSHQNYFSQHGKKKYDPTCFVHTIWQKSAEFYLFPRYLSWAIPILGFIGTVLGISLAAEGIQKIISSQQGLLSLSSQLGEAVSPLGIAFDTTLIALSLSVILTLLQTVIHRWENSIVIGCENLVLSKFNQ